MALPPKRKKERRKGGGNWRAPGHRALVRTRECSVPGCRQGPVETAHVRLGTDGGMGLKPSDFWCISLCHAHHEEQHKIGEATFELRHFFKDGAMRKRAIEFAKASPHYMKWQRETGHEF